MTVSVPGREPLVHVRTVVDRGPDPERAASPRLLRPDELVPLVVDRAGPLALQPLHHVMVSTGGMSPWWHTVRQGHAIEFVNRLLQDQGSAASYSLPELLLPFAVANEGLVLASERSIVPSLASGNGLVAFVAEPRVFVVSLGLGSGEPTSAQGSTNLMHDQVRVLGAEGSEHAAARRQLWYGTLETALETEQAMRIAANGGEGASVQSVSTLMGGPLTVLGPDLGAPSDVGTARISQSPCVRDDSSSYRAIPRPRSAGGPSLLTDRPDRPGPGAPDGPISPRPTSRSGALAQVSTRSIPRPVVRSRASCRASLSRLVNVRGTSTCSSWSACRSQA